MPRRFAAVLLLALAAAGCGRAENSLLLLDQLPDVASITIEGNEAFSDGTLKELMTLREPSRLNPFRDNKYRKAQLKTDASAILTYYLRHGYLLVRVEEPTIRESKGKVHVIIRVEEGAPFTVRDVGLIGLASLPVEEVSSKLATKPGKPLDPFRLQEDRKLILSLLADRGLWEARADANVQFFGAEAVVFYRVVEGDPVQVRNLTVSNNRLVEDRVVLREISIREGDLLRRRELEKSQTRLIQSGFFSDARWDTAGFDSLEHRIDVNFRVRERRLHWWEGGVGISSRGQLRLSGQWGSRSFVGTGMRFAVNSQTDFDLTDRLPTLLDEHRTDLILNLRRLFGTSWEGQPNVFYRYDQEVVVNTPAAYSQHFLGTGFSARLRFGDLRNQLVFSLERQWVWNVADSIARESDSQLARAAYGQWTLTGWVERDTRNSLFNPTRGRFHDASLQFATGAIGGRSRYVKGTLGTVGFTGIPLGAAVLGGRVRFGYIWPPSGDPDPGEDPLPAVERVPTQDRYRLGGANTVRGYEQDELNGLPPSSAGTTLGAAGGLAQILGSVEVRAPLFWKFGLVGFMDAGNVWQDPGVLSFGHLVPSGDRENVSANDLRYTYGLGLRLNTPVGPVRVDYAWKWNQPEGDPGRRSGWHVAIGQAF